jgi:hypothetical protein
MLEEESVSPHYAILGLLVSELAHSIGKDIYANGLLRVPEVFKFTDDHLDSFFL